ncbi:(d)CMP kinase [Ammoniphilus sp. YIM 78166]|uniref:(d)CMP kinase n=1 Tax=Ammoniphilus sp. YIM 78166 TaxID=1644106 RepID=UPI00106F82E2|nr:(d)CMP kinase [Ammoniphilus sp. YIM 78166]
MNIAIDGPAGAGKSTVAQLVAKQVGFTYIDTGAMYRALTLRALDRNVPLVDEEGLVDLLRSMLIILKPGAEGQKVFVGDTEVTDDIRHPEVSRNVSIVAKHPKIRHEMMVLQRNMAKEQNVVMDGRDIGTHVLPSAEVKVFLTASIEERAQRRYKELQSKGHPADLSLLKEEIALRDKLDSERETAPLRCAEDATILDSTGLSIDQVVEKIVELYRDTVESRRI